MSGSAKASPGVRLAVDYLPLVLFFAVNFLVPSGLAMRLVHAAGGSLPAVDQLAALVIAKVLVATAVFVVATFAALIVSKWKLGGISPMLWITAVLVVVFGGLTWWFQDIRFIQMKPTFVYSILAALLGLGLVTGRPLLEQLLGVAYPGLNALGWRRLTINWMLFFIALALANEIARHLLSPDGWVLFKFPGCAVASFAFAIANVPMLLKHGLTLEDGAAEKELPPE